MKASNTEWHSNAIALAESLSVARSRQPPIQPPARTIAAVHAGSSPPAHACAHAQRQTPPRQQSHSTTARAPQQLSVGRGSLARPHNSSPCLLDRHGVISSAAARPAHPGALRNPTSASALARSQSHAFQDARSRVGFPGASEEGSAPGRRGVHAVPESLLPPS